MLRKYISEIILTPFFVTVPGTMIKREKVFDSWRGCCLAYLIEYPSRKKHLRFSQVYIYSVGYKFWCDQTTKIFWKVIREIIRIQLQNGTCSWSPIALRRSRETVREPIGRKSEFSTSEYIHICTESRYWE